jgi:hypothetical protein
LIVGAFLAEAASAVNNKLSVSGGVLLRFAVEAIGWPTGMISLPLIVSG